MTIHDSSEKKETRSAKANFPNVSVIIPVYNAETTISDCIVSLLKLDYPKEKFELIFVNNSSTDGTADILSTYRDRIRILYEKKRGPSAARNNGILNARGEIIAFTDADCIVQKDWLKHLVKQLWYDEVGIVGGRIEAKKPCNNIGEFSGKLHDHDRSSKAKMPYAISMNWSSRKSVLTEVGLFDERFLRTQDVDFSFRIFLNGYKIMYEPKAIVYHREPNTLTELFRKAYLSGYYGIKFYKKHEEFHKKSGLKRLHNKRLKRLFTNLKNYLQKKEPSESLCNFSYDLGYTVGKIVGSIRYFYFDV